MIIQVLPTLNQGGVERGTIEIASFLQKKGIPNCVLSAGGKMVPELEKLHIEHITLPVATKNPIKIWLNSRKMAEIFKQKKADLIHVRSRAPAWSVKLACIKTGIPYIATYHGCYGIKPSIKKIYNRVMLHGKKVIAVSQFIKNHLQKEYHLSDNFIRVIPRGADLNIFNPNCISAMDKDNFLKEHNIHKHPIITLVGRQSRIKGYSVLLDAICKMNHHDMTLLLVGGNPKGNYEEELKQKLTNLPKEVDVKMFSVPGDKMPLVYAVTDIYVQPSLVPESFGRSIAEAGAMGCIIVASNHGGACELIQPEISGFLTPVGDAQVLAETLDHILDLPNPEKMKKNISAFIQQNYSIQKMCEETLKLYQEIIHDNKVND